MITWRTAQFLIWWHICNLFHCILRLQRLLSFHEKKGGLFAEALTTFIANTLSHSVPLSSCHTNSLFFQLWKLLHQRILSSKEALILYEKLSYGKKWAQRFLACCRWCFWGVLELMQITSFARSQEKFLPLHFVMAKANLIFYLVEKLWSHQIQFSDSWRVHFYGEITWLISEQIIEVSK